MKPPGYSKFKCFNETSEEVAMSERKPKVRIVTLIISLLVPLLVGCFSTLLTMKDMKIYDKLERPPLAPPGWLFPIIWTLLYIMMGLASYFVLTAFTSPFKKWIAMCCFYTQLLMNFFWPILFFTYSRYILSLIWLIVMFHLIVFCTFKFFTIRKISGIFMCVLSIWTLFAIYLNFAYVLYSR